MSRGKVFWSYHGREGSNDTSSDMYLDGDSLVLKCSVYDLEWEEMRIREDKFDAYEYGCALQKAVDCGLARLVGQFGSTMSIRLTPGGMLAISMIGTPVRDAAFGSGSRRIAKSDYHALAERTLEELLPDTQPA